MYISSFADSRYGTPTIHILVFMAKIIITRVSIIIIPHSPPQAENFEVLRLQKHIFLCQNCVFALEKARNFIENPSKLQKFPPEVADPN